MTIKLYIKIFFGRKSCQSFCWLYEGQMMNDKHHGYGLLTKVNQHGVKKKCYAGHWINGKFEGLGEYWYDNGDYYEGNFHNGKKSHFGRMWYNDGSFYQGFWKKDLYNDKGMIIYGNHEYISIHNKDKNIFNNC